MKVKEIGEYPGRSGSNASQYVSAPSEIILPQDIDRLCLSCCVLVKVVGPVHEDGMQGNLAEVTLSDVAEHFRSSVAYTSRLLRDS